MVNYMDKLHTEVKKFEFSVPATGAKGKKYMKKNKQIKYSDVPLGKVKIVKDFLPTPEKLVLKEETVKITLSLTKSSIDFFKQQARQHHTQYQKMIRTLLDHYSSYYEAQESA